MKVPMKWLGEFVDTGLAPKDLAYRMTMAGLEAEKIEEIGDLWNNVYVGYVTAVKRHPDADRLVLADIEAGEHKLTVVTGAPNIAQGQKVALALAGAKLYDGHSEGFQLKTLKPGMIRGVKSEGMACSEKELGISEEHEGILVLADDAPVGAPLKEYLGDTVIEFEITPNLVHAFSIQGIAREAAALTRKSVQIPALADLNALPRANRELVQIAAPDVCSRYIAIVFEGPTIGPSPEWLVRRITAAGLRPISNIVDATNYVMHEIGQPLHAFDLDALDERRIVVRRARDDEQLETLDHVQRSLTGEMLVIADANKAVGLAGVIGGFNSEISDATKTVILEGANFNMTSVRRTARALKIRTDASARFERGLDPNLVGEAMARATALILELSPGASVTAIQDVYPSPVTPGTLTMPVEKIARHLGVSYSDDEILDALTRLDFSPSIGGAGPSRTLTVTIPTYRRDVSIPEDIVEEVARLIGYEGLPTTLPVGQTVQVKRDPAYELRKSVRDTLTATGASEAMTYSAVAAEELAPFSTDGGRCFGFVHQAPAAELLKLRNPIQADRDLMRPTLVPSLIQAASANLKHVESVRLFEIAHVYLPIKADELPEEIDTLTLVLAGRREPTGLNASREPLDYLDLKGAIDDLTDRLGLELEITAESYPGLHPGRSAVVRSGETIVGRLGEVHPDVARFFGIDDTRVGVAELDLGVVLDKMSADRREITVSRFLPVHQDFAIIVDESTTAAAVERALISGSGPLVKNVRLFDIFRGSQIGEGKKSMAFRVVFEAPDRALTDADLVKVRGKLERVLKQQINGLLRA
jgi:phenylalanyl-tRNA synthetase beta chain